MRYAKRIIAFLVLSAIILCMPLFSVSAAGSLSDWLYGGPYATDFYYPAGGSSAVVDIKAGNVYRRFVFPNNSNVAVAFDGGQLIMMWSASDDSDIAYNYYNYSPDTGFNVHDYEYVKPIISGSGNVYLGEIRFPLAVDGVITNVNVESENNPDGIIKTLPFPDSSIAEEHKTQGMIAQLIQDIKDWFSNLIESMGNFFTELANKIGNFFTELGNKIGGFFTDLANKIGDFFTKLWNKIWWGNENGESEYEPPDVGSKFDEVIASLNDWLSQLKGFSDTVDSQGDEVAEYISTGSNAVTKFLTYAPAPILIFLTFGIVFVVVRKVVGR